MKVKEVIKLFVPPILLLLNRKIFPQKTSLVDVKKAEKEAKRLQNIAPNVVLNGKHQGERCFIVGSGTSIKEQNLDFLENEYTFVLNSTYLHPDFKKWKANYLVFSGVEWHKNILEASGYDIYREIEAHTDTEIVYLLNETDIEGVQKYNHLSNRQKYYFAYTKQASTIVGTETIDLAQPLWGGQNVAQLALQIAIGMGFKEIYLLGIDHDYILHKINKTFPNFYKEDESIAYKSNSKDDNTNLLYWFKTCVNLWSIYEKIQLLALHHKVKIFNSNRNSILDVFPYKSCHEISFKQD
jgi:hypothetical protein